MFSKRRVAPWVMLALGAVAFTACSDNSQDVQSSADNALNGLAMNVSQSELTLLRAGGLDVADGKGVFSIGWRQLFDPRNQTASMVGHAMAIGFETGQQSSVRRAGVDMGSVYINYGGNHLALQKHTGRDGGIVYTSMSGPRDNPSNANIAFVSNGEYEFEVSGSEKFSALRTTLTAPAALLDITHPSRENSISSTNDLTINWTGGNTDHGVLVAVAAAPPKPSGPPPQGPGERGGPLGDGDRRPGSPEGGMGHPPPGGHPPMLDSARAIIVRLDHNSGAYTVSASALQELIARTGAKGLLVTVSQLSVTGVEHDGGTVHVAVRNGDGVMVRLVQ